jgi:leader peptidase (prepilin peptidase)/N-methyltransferase
MAELAEAIPAHLIAIWAALVGAVVGSFLNVVVARVPRGLSIVRPASRCPACGTPIRWYDNVPVVSWLLLRARCRACRARISVRYPVVELLGAAAALAAIWHRGPGLAALAEFVFAAFLVALAAIDLDTWLLPHSLTWPLATLGLVASAVGIAPARSLANSALGAGLGFMAFASVAVIGKWIARREALGFGDVWLLCGLGAWLGAAALVPVVLLASLQGTAVGLGLMLAGKAQTGERRAAVPPSDAPPADEESAPPAEGGPPPAPKENLEPDQDQDWVPPRNAVPFGPFLALAAVEWLFLARPMARLFPALGLFR